MRIGPCLASVFAVTLFAGSVVRAEDAPKTDGGKAAGGEVKKDDAATARVDRAKQMVKELEDAVARARAAQPVDAQLLLALTQALDQARALAKPAKPEELTPDEKKAVVDDAKAKQGPGGDGGAKNPGQEWADKRMAAAFDGADLTEEEQIKAKKIIGDWWQDVQGAWTGGDSKKVSDLNRKRNDDLEKALGAKKAHKVINNLDAMKPGRK